MKSDKQITVGYLSERFPEVPETTLHKILIAIADKLTPWLKMDGSKPNSPVASERLRIN